MLTRFDFPPGTVLSGQFAKQVLEAFHMSYPFGLSPLLFSRAAEEIFLNQIKPKENHSNMAAPKEYVLSASEWNEGTSGQRFFEFRANGSGINNFWATLDKATRFPSISQALTALQKAASSLALGGVLDCNINIEVVTETPGQQSRRVLTDCQGCEPGERVQYAIENTRLGNGFLRASIHTPIYTRWDCLIDNAHLFNSISEAAQFQAADDGGQASASKSTIRRVVVKDTPAVLTATVLS